MENVNLNRQAVQLLAKWDPFQLGEDSYETETADVVAALQGTSDVEQLAEVIQRVYEYSFEQWIPQEQCVEMAEKLVQLRHIATCDI